MKLRIGDIIFNTVRRNGSKSWDNRVSQLVQRQLYLNFRGLAGNGKLLPSLNDCGFRLFSQSDEDGLLLYIFSLIGFASRTLVDMACGKPQGANGTNLILNWGFHGLLIDGDPANIRACERFYRNHPDTVLFPPRCINSWITAENVNDLIRDNGFSGEIDLLSLDVDGVDYWLWDRLQAVSPRVVMVEYQDCFSTEEAVTVPYSPDFDRHSHHPDYFGASLAAFVKLGLQKGYRLVGCNKYGYNAFFIRNDIVSEFLPEIKPDICLLHPKVRENRERKRMVLDSFTWQEV